MRQAAGLLQREEEPKLLAGGHTLIPTMKLRLAGPKHIVDMSQIEDLVGIEDSARSITIGAMTTHHTVANSEAVKAAIPALADLAGMIGDPAVRHRGTIGGSIANDDPNADYPAACLGLGATIITNKRRIEADDFFKGLFETALEDDEIITKVQFPKVPARRAYIKFPNPCVALCAGWRVRCQARSEDPRGGDRRGFERRVSRAVVRGGAQETLWAEVARRHDDRGRWDEQRHPWQRRISCASRRRTARRAVAKAVERPDPDTDAE